MESQNYSALTGGAAGGVVTTVSRSGTRTLHGSAAFTLRSQAFAAVNPFSLATTYTNGAAETTLVKPHDLRENFVATLGGPAVRGARPLFYFGAVEVQRRGFPAISSPENPAFYNLTPIQQALLANRGVSPAATSAALTYLSSLTGKVDRRQDQETGFGRLDWQPASRLDLGLEYHAARWTSPAGLTESPTLARRRASLGNATAAVDSLLLHGTATLRPRLVNQFHLQLAQDLQYETPQTPLPQEPAIGPGGLSPEVNIGPDGLLFGTPATVSRQAYPAERRLGAGDTLTLQAGRHLLEIGGDWSLVHDRAATLANAAGTFLYDSARTTANAGGLVDFITDHTFNVNAYPSGGCPSILAAPHLFCYTSFSQSFGETDVAFNTQEWAGFAQDTWHPRQGLTLHLGLRYEYLLLPLPANPNPELDALFSARGATGIFPEDRNNVGPRAAAAWTPFGPGRGVVRLGYGLYYGRLPGATVRAALADTALPASTTRIRITPSVETACPQTPAVGFGYPCSFPGAPPTGVLSTSSALVFDRRFRLPAVQQGSLALERPLGRRIRLTASYLLNLDRQLATSTDLNILPASTTGVFQLQGGTGAPGVRNAETFVLPVYTSRVTSEFGPVTDLLSNVNASYNALVVAAQTQSSRALHAAASYTWSKALDDGPNLSATPRTDNQFDPFTNGYDKGLSALNYPQSLRLAGLWTPRIHGPDHRTVSRILNGWTLAPVVLARSGRPYSYELYGGTRLSGGHLSLNGSGGALYLPTVGRDTLRLPASINANLRLARELPLAWRPLNEPTRLHLGAEVFNLTNRLNLSSVEERAFLVGTPVSGVTPLVFQSAAAIAAEGLNTQAFGTPTSASASLARERQLQLTLRLDF